MLAANKNMLAAACSRWVVGRVGWLMWFCGRQMVKRLRITAKRLVYGKSISGVAMHVDLLARWLA